MRPTDQAAARRESADMDRPLDRGYQDDTKNLESQSRRDRPNRGRAGRGFDSFAYAASRLGSTLTTHRCLSLIGHRSMIGM